MRILQKVAVGLLNNLMPYWPTEGKDAQLLENSLTSSTCAEPNMLPSLNFGTCNASDVWAVEPRKIVHLLIYENDSELVVNIQAMINTIEIMKHGKYVTLVSKLPY